MATKRQLKRILRRVIKETHVPRGTILDLAAQDGGVHIDDLIQMFGEEIFDTIDRLQEDGLLYMEDDGTVISLRGY